MQAESPDRQDSSPDSSDHDVNVAARHLNFEEICRLIAKCLIPNLLDLESGSWAAVVDPPTPLKIYAIDTTINRDMVVQRLLVCQAALSAFTRSSKAAYVHLRRYCMSHDLLPTPSS